MVNVKKPCVDYFMRGFLYNGRNRRRRKKKRNKTEEFPNIAWANNANPDIQMCILLYDERVNTWHRMQEIDALMDENPALSLEMVELDIRNRAAHAELQACNDCGVFVYKHPLTMNRKAYDDEMSRLYDMKKTDPAAFIKEIENIGQNLRRIKSNLSTKKYKSDEEREVWRHNLSRAEMRRRILQDIITK